MAKSHTVTIPTDGVGLDLSDLRLFSKALRKAEPALAKGVAKSLRAAGAIVANEIKVLSADASVTIPPSVKVRVAGLTVSVVAGGNGIPLAGLMDRGNSGRSSSTATNNSVFRHPVFGNMDVWVDQPMHPFMIPGLDRTREAATTAILAVVNDVLTQIAGDIGG